MNQGDINYQWARCFINGLVSAGVRHFAASPGSRSTPLILAALSNPNVALKMHVDERCAAFYALGQARATGTPAAVIATSGSAGAHFLPAIIEACHSHIPLLLLTADRPPEAQGTGANQTIDQVKLFGDSVRKFFTAGLPEDNPALFHSVAGLAVRAATTAKHPLPGPVHVNLPFRPPLEPSSDSPDATYGSLPVPPRIAVPKSIPDSEDIQRIADEIRRFSKGWIICGPSWNAPEAAVSWQTLEALSNATGFSVICEISSGVFATNNEKICTGGLDFISRMAESNPKLRPDCIVEIGGSLTSGAYQRVTAAHPEIFRTVFSPYLFRDPQRTARSIVLGDLQTGLTQLVDALTKTSPAQTDHKWRKEISRAVDCWRASTDELLNTTSFNEGHICRAVSRSICNDTSLVIGNSLVIRDLDMFARFSASPGRVMHQRGASGIDGLIAGASGACDALNGKVVAIVGDLSARHDIGSLAALRNDSAPLVIVVVQNSGGRIFQQLPLGSSAVSPDWIQRAFVMPDGPSVKQAAAAFNLPCVETDNETDLALAVEKSLAGCGAVLVEAVVAEADSRSWRRRLDAMAQRSAGQSN